MMSMRGTGPLEPEETDDPMDLTSLGPVVGTPEWEELVARVMNAAGPELERRSAAPSGRPRTPGPLSALAQWSRPILAAAGVVGLLATGVLQWGPAAQGNQIAEEPALLPEVLGLPSTVAMWLDEERAPTTRDLVLAMEDGGEWR